MRPANIEANVTQAVIALLAFSACGGDAGSNGTVAGATTPVATADAGVATRPARSTYRETALASVGRVTGTVSLDGAPPADSVVHLSGEQATDCGASVVVNTIDAPGGKIAGAIVWLEGIRAGKPLPLERRYALEHQECMLTPRQQPAIIGGTINIVSDDRIAHVTEVRTTRSPTPLATIHFDFEGQVVPLDRVMRERGRLEIACTLHPWSKAWVQVFDHPYFTTTASDGAFTIDSVPPGRYAIVMWQERTGEVRDSITVVANGDARIEVKAHSR